MQGPTSSFWANLTPFSLEEEDEEEDEEAEEEEPRGEERRLAAACLLRSRRCLVSLGVLLSGQAPPAEAARAIQVIRFMALYSFCRGAYDYVPETLLSGPAGASAFPTTDRFSMARLCGCTGRVAA